MGNLWSDYAGDLSITNAGKACIPWNEAHTLVGGLDDLTNFPESTWAEAGNKCR